MAKVGGLMSCYHRSLEGSMASRYLATMEVLVQQMNLIVPFMLKTPRSFSTGHTPGFSSFYEYLVVS